MHSPHHPAGQGRRAVAQAENVAAAGLAALGAVTAAPPVNAANDNAGLQPGVDLEQGKKTTMNCAVTEAECQHFANMQARAALCGCSLYALADGGYLVGRWGYSRAVPCLRAVGDLLRQIGGR